MKKFIGAICSAAAGALTFLFLSLNGLVQKITVGSVESKEGVSGWDILSDFENVEGLGLYKFSTIALIIAAVALIAFAVVLILQSLKVIKSKFNFAKLNNIILTIFVIFALLALIAAFIMAKDLLLLESSNFSIYAGIGAWLNLVVGAVACLLGWVFAKK
ncbi:MAG: hypothetical protein IJD48_00175 [Clostridia bacterium]|nr:hypothetical protein [Clostridia bacterium]